MPRHNPVIKKRYLEIPAPSLSDTLGDYQRLLREIERETRYKEVEVDLSLLEGMGRILRDSDWKVTVTFSEIDSQVRLVNLEKGNTEKALYALSCDIGTTTLVMNLIDLNSGKTIESRTSNNPQRVHGADVTSRMIYCKKENGLRVLNELLIGELNLMIEQSCKLHEIRQNEISGLICAGNTIMAHIFLRLDPTTIRIEPYVPLTTLYPSTLAASLGIKINPHGVIKFLPCVSGYIGSDITAGILSTGLNESDNPILLIDIGTNGETVLGNRDWMVACSGSAGSAFEGCGLEFGMNAASGAIEGVTLREDGELRYKTIHNESPMGICGSGLIDLLAQMLKRNMIDRRGRINAGFKSPRIKETDAGLEFIIAFSDETQISKDITLTQADIDNLIRDKAALYAGSTILLKSMQMELGAALLERCRTY
ncbi:ASKHA domain-containing protein [Desulfoferrobacter suflitae]|uniref:ASKHA domain-containing protein n=1 Tax=Desulfoferrobacter suflitae TaxID=2865782 RepID=UPI002164A32E|nr:ASKHA domain-containing protein [Desulfoferrobacter suflitae]MCK8603697.1 ASKHA domain-containing protein [Desulfoferrobacter suflitae]